LLVLERNGYARHDACRCPACNSGIVCGSLAFRVPSANRPFVLQAMGRTPIVADANPAIQYRRAGRTNDLSTTASLSSLNHQQRGQNVLFADVSILWLVSPEVNGDNIYLPDGAKDAQTIPLVPHATFGDDIFLAQ
jgi:hypothetical protein